MGATLQELGMAEDAIQQAADVANSVRNAVLGRTEQKVYGSILQKTWQSRPLRFHDVSNVKNTNSGSVELGDASIEGRQKRS